MSTKQIVLDAVGHLPDDATFERIQEEIQILARLRQAEKASAEGRVTPQNKVRELVRQWTTQ